MPAYASQSAVVVRVPVPRTIERLRRRWDPAAAAGVPAHITILYPFLAPAELNAGVRRAIAEIAAVTPPFGVRFARIERFPTVVYLAPEPSEPFIRLTEAVHARFPEFPPYEGAFDVVIPHLTIADSTVAPLDDIAAEAASAMPFGHAVSRLDVLVEGPNGRWHSRWRLRLGHPTDSS